MRRRIIGVFLSGALGVAACSGSSAESDAPVSEVTSAAPTSAPPDTVSAAEPLPTDPVAPEPTTVDSVPPDTTGGTAPEQPVGELTAVTASMSDLLATIPLAAYEVAVAGGRTVQIDLIDLDVVAEAAGAERPPADDVAASLDWAFSVSVPDSPAEGGNGFGVMLPTFVPDPAALSRSEDVAAELGFSMFDIDRSATLFALDSSVAVFSGADLALSPDLVDVGGGIVSAGDGDDGAFDPAERTVARPLGRPLRFGVNGPDVVASLSTPVVQSWLDGGPTMTEQPKFASAAAAMDDVGVVSGFFLQSDFAGLFGDLDVPDAVVLSQAFSVVGIGSSVIDGGAANVIVYVFDNDAAAAAVVPELDDAWRNGELVGVNQAASDLFDVRAVEQRGDAVVVTTLITDQATTTRALDILFRGDPIFANN